MLDLEAETEPGLVGVVAVDFGDGVWRVSLPLISFFLSPSLTWVCLQVKLELVEVVGVVWTASSLEDDLGFFLSDRIGELDDPKDRGLFEDPSGLEVSDFLEEEEKKSLFLKTIFFFFYSNLMRESRVCV